MSQPPKARIRQSFERAAATYDAAADVQRRICARLAAGMSDAAPARLLDAGCGTGAARGLLQARYPAAEIVALDLSTAMLRRLPGACQRLAGDLEHLPLASASIDLYWSSLALQWCDPTRALGEARRVLRPGGRLALATLGPATFHEMRSAFRDVDAYRHTLHFHDAEQLAALAGAAGFTAVDCASHMETAFYPDLRALLRAVKAVGANQLGAGRRSGLMSRNAFARLAAAWETLRQPDGLPLSYDVILIHAQA